MAFRKISALVSVLIVLFAIYGCGSDTVPQAPKGKVEYVVAQKENITLYRELSGRVSAFTVSEVRPQVSGIIKERYFEEGADVTANEVLYLIDPAIYQAAYNNAKAVLKQEEANLVTRRNLADRYSRLVKTKAIGVQDYDDAIAAHLQAISAVTAAREALETASINLGYTQVTAPISGRIGKSKVTPGALVTANQADSLATIQQLSPVYVDVTQSNMELLKLRRALAEGELSANGTVATVRLKLEDGSPYTRHSLKKRKEGEKLEWIDGELLFSDITVDQSTGVVTIRAKFENPENVLLPGMYVRAILEEGLLEDAILIPQRALMRNTKGEPYVYVLAKEKPDTAGTGAESAAAPLGPDDYYIHVRNIVIDREYQNKWLISEGLQHGDIVVVEGLQKTRPGMPVSAKAWEPNPYAHLPGGKAPSGTSNPASSQSAAQSASDKR